MNNRKLNVSTAAGGKVMVKRTRFDRHIDQCKNCTATGFCHEAQSLWRSVCLEALRSQGGAS